MNDKPEVLLALNREQFEVILECCRDKVMSLGQLVGIDMVVVYSKDRGRWGEKLEVLRQVVKELTDMQRKYFK